MTRLRPVVFWLHLIAGVAAGVVILVMSVSGALLALKPQILNLVEQDARFVAPPPGAARLGPQAIVAGAQAARPGSRPATVTLQADPAASAAIAFGRDGTIYVDPYSGRALGEGSARAQRVFRSVEDWHRWLALPAESRATGRALTGASNLVFLLLAVSGPYLWWPRTWSWKNVRGVIWFRAARSARARDFNWHNVIGLWCAPLLIVLAITAAVMSYPWANAWLYRLAASPLPVAAAAPPAARGGADAAPAPLPGNLDAIWARAAEQVPSWRTMTARLPVRAGAPVTFTIVDARSWNAFARSTLTVGAADAVVAKWQPYDASSRGQKWRGWVRYGHTGELGGLPGQIVAGLASTAGAVLVWTGLALAWRRLLAWWPRSASRSSASASTRAARSPSSADT